MWADAAFVKFLRSLVLHVFAIAMRKSNNYIERSYMPLYMLSRRQIHKYLIVPLWKHTYTHNMKYYTK